MTKPLPTKLLNISNMATGYQGLDLNEACEDDDLLYDWEECEMRQIVRDFPISEYGTEYLLNQPSIEYPLISEPPTLSGIIDSTISKPQPRTISDVDEHYIEDDFSSLSDVSDIKVSNAPRKHEYGQERVERKGNIYDKLYNACLKGELSIVKDILENRDTLLVPDENGQTALYAACIGNHLEIINVLIDCGYDVNHQDNDGKTVLHIAFENHIPDLAQTLIDQFSANTDIRDVHNWTPLHTAIDKGYFSYSKELSKKFLHQDVGTEVSWIQLYAACFQENTQDVQFLLNDNTDVNHVSSAVYTSLLIAVTKGNIDIVTLLLDQDANVHSVTVDGKTPLHIAVDKGDETIIKKLLTHEADPSLKDAPGNTSLHLAVRVKGEAKTVIQKTDSKNISLLPASCYICSIQTVQAIIDHGADVNTVNNRGQTALWFACLDGQESFVKILLDAGADPSLADRHGDSCLHAAIHGQCSTETIQKIVDHGTQLNAVNKDGATPLLLACSAAQAEAVRLFLNAEADPNIAYADGDACLHAAIAADCSKEIIEEIINYGGEVNALNKRGRTALLLGCFYRQMDSVKVLLEAGADPVIADEEGFSCLHAAIDGYCSKDILQALIDHGALVDAKRKDGTNALLRACTTGQSESVFFLLEAGCHTDAAKPDGNNCLHEAVKGKCSKDTLQYIIEHDMNVNAVNSKGQTALLQACESNQGESIKLLLEKGADPNIADTNRYTSLHAAIRGCCTNETLKKIIAHKAYLNAQDMSGATALLLACSYRQQGSINVLLEAGSDPHIADKNGVVCLHLAVLGGCSKMIIRKLIGQGTQVNAKNKDNCTALMLAYSKGNVDVIKILLKAGADPNIADANGDTLSHYAVRGNASKEVLQNIIDHGADVNVTNNENQTALLLACEDGNENAITVLLKAGADPNIADADGDICLHDAVRRDNSKEVIQAIIDHGADVNATNQDNCTALMFACHKGNEEIINILLKAGADPSIADGDGDTCLYDAIKGDCSKDVLQAIIDHGAASICANLTSLRPLFLACSKGNGGAIEVLLNAGADVNVADTMGQTLLHRAILGRLGKDVLQTIVDHGANVNAANTNSVSPLMYACHKRNIDAMKVLMNAGAEPNIVDTFGASSIYHAIVGDCSKKELQTIIDYGADVNVIDKHNCTALLLACKKGNVGAIGVLLNAGAKPDTANENGDTCLHNAVRGNCSKKVLETMIHHGVDVNATNKRKESALITACWMDNINAVNILLNARTDPNIALDNGDTCLHYAVRNDCCTEVIQALISYSGDVNATNEENETTLMIACHKGNTDVKNVLLNAGADPNIADTDGNTCLHDAARNDCCTEVLQAIISHGGDVNATNKKNRTPLMLACWKRNDDAIHVLLNAGADLNIADVDGYTCLHYAARNGCCTEVLQAIISHGGDVNATSKENVTPLFRACVKGNKDTINVLLNAGADLNIADVDGYSCLHYAAGTDCCTEALQAIISHGGDVNATSKENVTPLMLACVKGNKDAINVLLNAGADPNIADVDGGTCLHDAAGTDCCTAVLPSKISHGGDVNATNKKNRTPLMLACWKRNEDAIHVLLNAGADLNIADASGDTCLHYAARNDCCTDVLQAIISHGGDVNATSKENVTPLIRACVKGNDDAIHVLLNAGADLNIADVDGYTCLHYAARNGCCTEVLQAIISHGGDVNATSKENVTPLFRACVKGNKDTINVFLNAGADLNIADVDGYSCLHYAAGTDCCTEALQAIISHGGDVNATSKENVTPLMLACVKGNKDAINVLLNAGADPNIADVDGDTCLHDAAGTDCCTAVLPSIISHGGDVNATNKKNRTPLMLACWKRNEDAIHVLLNAGADLNIADASGDTCLHYAARNDCCTDVLQAIISHGGDVNATSKENVTPLIRACVKGNDDAIHVLLNAGADLNIADVDGYTCLHYAARNGCCTEVLQAIISHGGDVNATSKENVTPLFRACVKGNKDTINVFLNAGADLNIADVDGYSCLHYAAGTDCCTEALQAIISHGGDVNATSKENVTPLMLACVKGNKDAINVLLNAGADPNIADVDGDTCLHDAAGTDCCTAVLPSIISHGGDVNATNKKNRTPLMLACWKRNEDAIHVLLDAGADLNIADASGDTCLHYAARNDCCTDVLQAIISHGGDVNATSKENVTPLIRACVKGNKDSINVLLNAGADPNIVGSQGYTCVHDAAWNECCTEALQAIISHGGDVNATSKENVTPLMLACVKGNKDAINVLLNAGADPNIADVDGDTCLHYAVRYDGYTDVLQAVISNGADVNATNKKNVTPLMQACVKGNKDAINVLLNAGADPNIADVDGGTCLHYAAGTDCCTEAILRSGADTTIVNIFGDTCLHQILRREYLSNKCDQETLQMLLDHGVPVNATNKNHHTAYMLACHQGNIDAMCALVNAGADPNIADSWGNTSLHLVAQKRSRRLVLENLMEHGADVNAVNNEGATALMLACETGQKGSVNLLLRAGGDTSILDVRGNTCLHKLNYRECDQETLQMLLDHGAPVNAINKNHHTAYMLACDQGNIDAMSTLENGGADPNIDSDNDDTNISCDVHIVSDDDDDDDANSSCIGCCSNLSLHTIVHWLNPTPRQDAVTLDTLSTERLESNNSDEFVPFLHES